MASYQKPEWAQSPPPEYQNWYLVEIKGGVEVAKHAFHTRNCTVFGRAVDMVDIPIHHESASRQHARIAFDSQGIPWLRDLSSTHGTTCNKKGLPPQAIGKVESNSLRAGARGIMLFPGDVLQFGGSTRLFCVEGPSDFERGVLQARLEQQKQKELEEEANMKSSTEKNEVEVSWGIRMDDEDVNLDSSSNVDKKLPMDIQVPEKHRKSLERLNTMKYKLANLQTEDERIRRKGELSEGQERQLQRNAEREEALQKSIAELETELYDKLHPEQSHQTSRHNKTAESREALRAEDDDDFFDRTRPQQNQIIGDNESEESLISKWKRLQSENRSRETGDLESARNKVKDLSATHARLLERGETEDAFFIQNDLQLAQENLEKIVKQRLDASAQMAEVEAYLRVVNSKLHMDRETGYIGEGPPIKPDTEGIPGPKPESNSINENNIVHEPMGDMLPPPVRSLFTSKGQAESNPSHHSRTVQPQSVLPDIVEPKLEETQGDNSLTSVMPAPKRKRVLGPAMQPPSPVIFSQDQTSKSSKPSEKVQGTLAFISSASNTATNAKLNAKATGEGKSSVTTGTAHPIDLKTDTWRAPAGQDGSGITKLNAKFAGRY